MFILRMVSRQKPEIFELFPQAAASVSEFALSHLDHVTVDMVHNEIVANIIPGLKQVVEDEDVPADSEQSQLLSYYTAQPPSISTVRRWMHYLDLGFTHDKFKKSYYVDGHEREEQIQHRRQFTTRYLSDIEKFTYRWVQMPVAKLQSIQSLLSEDEKIIPCGHRYWDPVTNEEWVEFHVDDHDFEDCAVELYGGNLSVRMPAAFKPIIILSQDESIFNQNSHRGSQWVGPSGERTIMPKSTGMGIMLSAFQSRDVSSTLLSSSYVRRSIDRPLIAFDCCVLVWMGYGPYCRAASHYKSRKRWQELL